MSRDLLSFLLKLRAFSSLRSTIASVVSLVLLGILKTGQLGTKYVTTTPTLGEKSIDSDCFPDEKELKRVLDRLGSVGSRTTGSEAHNLLLAWLEQELRKIDGLTIHSDEYDILRWETCAGDTLKDAAKLIVACRGSRWQMPVAGAVPFAKATDSATGQLVYVPQGTSINSADVKGKVILRDFPVRPVPYSTVFLPSYSMTSDLKWDVFDTYDRPGQADMLLKDELVEAGEAGAAGMIVMFDVTQKQIESYFEPHQGVHYRVPALYVGAEQAAQLKEYCSQDATVTLSIEAQTAEAVTRNLFATLPGQTDELIIFQTHTDGNTFVQENGLVALLALAQYYARLSLQARKRTIQFAFNTGHLHISREGTQRHAEQLDRNYDDGKFTLIIPMEHLGTREIEAKARADGKPGRELAFSGRGELMIWCVGPSPPVVAAVKQAVERRKLDRTLVTRGTSFPQTSQVPTYSSFGGIGTYYHNLLLPTTSLISGPWSLWAPFFGAEAVDVSRLRAQAMALGDVYLALEDTSRDEILQGYTKYRWRKEQGARTPASLIPREIA